MTSMKTYSEELHFHESSNELAHTLSFLKSYMLHCFNQQKIL